MAERSRIIGIDLGTTNTVVAHVRNRIPKVVPSERGNLVIPSMVALASSGDLLVGGPARDQAVTNPRNTVSGAKRLIGRPFESLAVQELKSALPYEIVPGPDGAAAVKLGERVLTLPEVSSHVLAHAKKVSELSLGGLVTEAVITVPAWYNDNQRSAVKEAGRLAGLEVKRILNEPTAAALAYGFNRKLRKKVLVYDLGGGTFDVSVLQLDNNVFEVLATGGDTFLGGVDFDRRVAEHVVRVFEQLEGMGLSTSPVARQRIQFAAESAKMDLSVIPNVMLELPFITERRGKPVDLRVPLTRDQLNALTQDLVDRTFAIVDGVLAQKGIRRQEIDEVLLVGGQSRMPLVQQAITAHFGKPPRKGVHPDECVALGAALFADSLGALDAVTLLDALFMPIGYAQPSGAFKAVLERNLPIPGARSFRLPPPRESDPAEISLELFQGDAQRAGDNEFLGRLVLPASAAGQKVELRVDAEGLLTVTVGEGANARAHQLSTRDTPEAVRRTLADRDARKAGEPRVAPAPEPGLLSSLKKMFGRG
ncbi:MAG: Hsp70 family protein [Deltaproteobacteria bacterium]|nr:Hsp70 family protein [Deltaproteobacteria bacterium]